MIIMLYSMNMQNIISFKSISYENRINLKGYKLRETVCCQNSSMPICQYFKITKILLPWILSVLKYLCYFFSFQSLYIIFVTEMSWTVPAANNKEKTKDNNWL